MNFAATLCELKRTIILDGGYINVDVVKVIVLELHLIKVYEYSINLINFVR